MKKLSAAALLVLATTAYAQPYDNSMTEDAIKKRLAPVGAVILKARKLLQPQLLLALALVSKCTKAHVLPVTVLAH